ncbi:STAS domain-containing protein [Lignipirellula cremea]|uniref:STAS domain protein n=1 Tax=Lignipirellula cremea TaxID=2528010 RepID=A0A518DYI9_9BACT|nr:STAS domain-containing protein [Lignipirellula cremea]QDU96907.1 STAS domain protein [Lignipirellula cremea]
MSSLRSEENGDIVVVYFNEAKILDEARIQQIGKELMDMVAKASSGKLLVCFQGVTFMSSAMIGKIILLNKKCKETNVKLKLCDICDNVLEVFKLMRLNKILDIHPDVDKAIAAFEKKGWFG